MADDEKGGERARAWAGGGYSNNDYDAGPSEEQLEAERRAEALARERALRDEFAKNDPWRGKRPAPGAGLLLGRFVPPHLGHVFAVQSALALSRSLTVLVCGGRGDPLPIAQRVDWLAELAPTAQVRPATLETLPAEGDPLHLVDTEFLVKRTVPEPPARLFGSDEPHRLLAERLGVEYVPIDPARAAVPISGTRLRAELRGNFGFLSAPARAHLARRVAVVGPEGLGKSTLVARLAAHFATNFVPEYARTMAAGRGGALRVEDMPRWAAVQAAQEQAAARFANAVLFCDGAPQVAEVWSRRLAGGRPAPALASHAWPRRRYDLALVFDEALPFLGEKRRDDAAGRAFVARELRQRFLSDAVRMVRVSARDADERFELARTAVEQLLAQPLAWDRADVLSPGAPPLTL